MLSKCAWKVLSMYLKQGIADDGAAPGAVIAVQTFGDFLNFNPPAGKSPSLSEVKGGDERRAIY